ncbi:MAG: transglycosylase SLT domain-containing protein [Gammaproteobacteria bacterium]|nr:transglycosylase SLT domain-containing protein [Gammaproteobacteria bacterium]
MTDKNTEMDIMEEDMELSSDFDTKTHPWRICPIGTHLVRTHDLHIPPSKKHPEGSLTTRHKHCAANPSKKDVLSFEEIQEMTKMNFSNLSAPPTPNVLSEFPRADEFDQYICGWVRYWNDIFNPKMPLDSNLVKALIATESGFDPISENIVGKTHARGLMQIIVPTHEAIGDHHGELKNYLIHVKLTDLFDPSTSICIGVRWLFRKKETASSRLHREATWIEAIEDYKSYLKDMIADKNYIPKPISHLQEYYIRLREH